MINLKNYIFFFKITLSVIFTIIYSCAEHKNVLTNVETKKIALTQEFSQNPDIDYFVKPYREHINKDLNEVLAYNPEMLDKKDGKWQTNIGNLIADIVFEKGNLVFNKRQNKSMDICILNHGGIRSVLPQGNISTKVAFQIMPFENSLHIIELKGQQIQEMTNFIITEKKPHPLSGITFTIDKDKKASNILIQGKNLEPDKIYYVGTNDYLANGGDNMNFFKKNTGSYDLEYKLRNILIDYLKDVDTIKVNKDIRIIELNN